MTDFKLFAEAVNQNIKKYADDNYCVFTSSIDPYRLSEIYLESFPPGSNEIFRERTEHDCSCCKTFIRQAGRMVFLVEGQTVSIWSNIAVGEPYDTVARALEAAVLAEPIKYPYWFGTSKIGAELTTETTETSHIDWNHFYTKLPNGLVSSDIVEKRGTFTTNKEVLKRGLEELKLEDLNSILELIEDNNLYRGTQYKAKLVKFITLMTEYQATEDPQYFLLTAARTLGEACKFRNSVIGQIAVNMAEGDSLEVAVGKYEAMTAPQNYQRSKSLVTSKQIEKAKEKIIELGMQDAIYRRHANLNDITINNLIYADRSVKAQLDPFDELSAVMAAPVQLNEDRMEEISAQDFYENILPTAASIELLMEGRYAKNLVSLTAPKNPEGKGLFRWDNQFSWSYAGNFTDAVQQKVKDAGGVVDAKYRYTLDWDYQDDLDIHLKNIKTSTHIYYGMRSGAGFTLDIDANAGTVVDDPVENIYGNNITDGTYKIYVNNYQARTAANSGFTVQIKHDNEIITYDYPHCIRTDSGVEILTVTYKNNEITNTRLNDKLVRQNSSFSGSKLWDIPVQQFVKVRAVMKSPNHWDNNVEGNFHHFYILEDCFNPEPIRGFYNEYLHSSLHEHRKVFEMLGSRVLVEPSKEQLSGVGFSDTLSENIVLKVLTQSNESKLIKVKI